MALNEYNPYRAMAATVGLSEPTVRTALARQPTTFQVALRMSRYLRIDMECFHVVADNRKFNSGLNRGVNYVKKEDQAKAKGSSAEDSFRG